VVRRSLPDHPRRRTIGPQLSYVELAPTATFSELGWQPSVIAFASPWTLIAILKLGNELLVAERCSFLEPRHEQESPSYSASLAAISNSRAGAYRAECGR
jgi:hypothetical protein